MIDTNNEVFTFDCIQDAGSYVDVHTWQQNDSENRTGMRFENVTIEITNTGPAGDLASYTCGAVSLSPDDAIRMAHALTHSVNKVRSHK